MTNRVKAPGRAKANDREEKAGRVVRVAIKTNQPAQEIAQDEVEIAKTGGKPEEDDRPMTGDQRRKRRNS